VNLKEKIPNDYKDIINKITKAASLGGYTVYAVGGFVRDMVMNRIPNDLDIMVEKENGGIEFSKFLSKGLKISEPVIFERFGTAKLSIDGREIEFIMPRKEYYDENSRNPDTEIGSLMQDALRRDFTVNALFLRLNDMELVDLLNKGLKDIENKIIRVTDSSAADIIFSQDPLRILRAVRQSCQLGFKIEEQTYASMKKNAFRIKIVSPERIRDEINKMLECQNVSQTFKMLDELNLLEFIFPTIEKEKFVRYFFEKLPENNKTAVILAFLLGKKSDKILTGLKYPKDFIKTIVSVSEGYEYLKEHNAELTDSQIRKFEKRYRNVLPVIADLCFLSDKKRFDVLFKKINEMSLKNELIPEREMFSGEELMAIFKKPSGKWIAETKIYVEDLLCDNPKITKEETLKEIKLRLKKQSL
jgi:tRNA nucleotidyltransferase/poly(A) polymerase